LCRSIRSTKGLLELSDEDIERIMDVNLKSTYRTCKYLLPLMVENKRGLIINIGSKAGKLAHGVAGGIYAAAK